MTSVLSLHSHFPWLPVTHSKNCLHSVYMVETPLEHLKACVGGDWLCKNYCMLS